MKGLPFVLLFTAMTFLSWGAYGPTLHHGAIGLEHDSMRAFVAVGLAYFMIAVLIPVFVLQRQGEKGKWTLLGSVYSFFAGAVGAVGALGIILALAYGGRPVYVMPLVFGFAPVVNTLMRALLSRTFNQIRPIFLGGVVATALGAAGVLVFKPSPSSPAADAAAAEERESASWNEVSEGGVSTQLVAYFPQESQRSLATDANSNPASASEDAARGEDAPASESSEVAAPSSSNRNSRTLGQAESTGDAPPDLESTAAEMPSDSTVDDLAAGTQAAIGESDPSSAGEPQEENPAEKSASGSDEDSAVGPAASSTSVWGIVFSIVIAALCWGSYGPFLHIGQGKMDGSRLRPFACVGLAYFFIAVAVPLIIIYSRPEDLGAWKFSGMSWSFAAGVLGAIGALGVILAFNSGGKPFYVMPLIFGFAPVVNTSISLTEANTWALASIWFYLSLAVVIGGAVTVLTNAPKPKPKPAPAG